MSEHNFPSFSFSKFIRNALFFGKCAVCGSRDQGEKICEQCDSALDDAERSDKCFDIRGNGPEILKCAAEFTYEYDVVKKLVGALKRKYDKKLFRYAARRMMKAETCLGISGRILYVNVPRSTSGLRNYGFDQGQALARFAAKMTENSDYAGIIARRPFSGVQKTLSASERAENVKGKFRVKHFRARFAGSPENIVIVDDVLTTGSSASEAAKVVSEIFPDAKLYGLFLATTPKSARRYL